MVQAHKTPRVLIVEDEFYLAADLEVALQSEGAEVVGPMSRLSDASCQVSKGGFDAAVLDINLRNESTFCLAEELRTRRIPFVFATGYSPDTVPSRFSDVMLFEKPYDVCGLARHVVQLASNRLA